eukprot:3604309-Pleurochrysis_carterae.AAC.1
MASHAFRSQWIRLLSAATVGLRPAAHIPPPLKDRSPLTATTHGNDAPPGHRTSSSAWLSL